jgi:hypothetical protein
MNIELLSEYLQLAQYGVTFVGVPVAIGLFIREKRRERRSREDRAFDELDQAYVQFMRLCLEHPEVDADEPSSAKISRLRERTQDYLFAILISLFERVHLAFEGQHKEFRQRQRLGWIMFMESYTCRNNFRRVWNDIGAQFDTGFQHFMLGLIESPDSKPDSNPIQAG